MASVKYRLKGNSNGEKSIYVRLSIGRGALLETKTGFTILPTNWNLEIGFPRRSNPELKNLFNKLKKLESHIFASLNSAQGDGTEITKDWLDIVIANCFERKIVIEGNLVTTHVQYMIDNAASKKIPGKNKIGLSKSRVSSYITFKKNFLEFESYNRKAIKFVELNSVLLEKFKKWLLEVKGFSVNYSGKQLSILRAVANDADKHGEEMHRDALRIESFAEADEDRDIVTLSFEEIKKIQEAVMPTDALKNAQKWLLLGCEIGQRGGDLISITHNNIRVEDDYVFIDLIQKKTGKSVTIPVASREIKEMLLNEPPYAISQQKLNEYIKEVCRLSGIVEPIKGRILNKETNRKEKGTFPKYKLVTSHSFRRSFATNYYKKIATPILMTITGHSKESMFLKYINQQEDKDENARLFIKYYEAMKK